MNKDDIDWTTAHRVIDIAGYVVLQKSINYKTYRMREHMYVWELVNGKVPEGYEIHHINEIKHDNRITNLQLVDFVTHKRLHSGCEKINGEWWKLCRICNTLKNVNRDYYQFNDGISSYCKQCWIKVSYAAKKRNARKRRQGGL